MINTGPILFFNLGWVLCRVPDDSMGQVRLHIVVVTVSDFP
jgi:hypothetical protein